MKPGEPLKGPSLANAAAILFAFYAARFADLRTVGRPFAGGLYTVLAARDTPELAAAIGPAQSGRCRASGARWRRAGRAIA